MKRALVLEDDDIKMKFICALLHSIGIQDVTCVQCLEDANDFLDRKFDYLLSDWYLSDGTGGEFVREYERKHDDCRIIIYTAQPEKISCKTNGKIIKFVDLEKELLSFSGELNREIQKTSNEDTVDKEYVFSYLKEISNKVERHDVMINNHENILKEITEKLDNLSCVVLPFAIQNKNMSRNLMWIVSAGFVFLGLVLSIIGFLQ
jgi:CheY-like chemotaxis protein